jgi:hypothetical protein
MYVKERLRVYATWLVGAFILLSGSIILILSVAKVNYYADSRWLARPTSRTLFPCTAELGVAFAT